MSHSVSNSISSAKGAKRKTDAFQCDGTQSSAVLFEDVSFTYPGQARAALDHISLQVAKGDFAVILGANGSGKSTLAKLMNALLTAESGQVECCGLNLREPENARKVRKRCSMVFQNPDDQSVAPVVEDDVAFGPENLCLERPEIQRRVAESLVAVGMSAHAKAQIAQLSGGQKQRVAIAGALAMKPQLLVLDEPGSMLDVKAREGLLRLLHTLNKQGLTVVLVTHDANEAIGASKMFVMEAGRIAVAGTPDEVFSQPQRLHELGLELPFELELKRRLEQKNVEPEQERKAPQRSQTGGIQTSNVDEKNVGANAHRHLEAAASEEQELIFKNLCFTYDAAAKKKAEEDHSALKNVSLQLKSGRILGVIGPTGSGKSTLLRIMAGLEAPTNGEIMLAGNGDSAQNLPASELRHLTGLVFQRPEHQLFAASVIEDVAFGPRNRGASKSEARAAAEEALLCCGLDPKSIGQSSPFLLSGGQQRRAALAGILAMKPRFLLLDEPCAGLDPQAREQLFALLEQLKQQGIGIALVTHSMEDAAQWCDSLLVLSNGRIQKSGTPKEVFTASSASMLEANDLALPWPQQYAILHKISSCPLTMGELTTAIALEQGGRRKTD